MNASNLINALVPMSVTALLPIAMWLSMGIREGRGWIAATYIGVLVLGWITWGILKWRESQ